jgi:hypothetical protein
MKRGRSCWGEIDPLLLNGHAAKPRLPRLFETDLEEETASTSTAAAEGDGDDNDEDNSSSSSCGSFDPQSPYASPKSTRRPSGAEESSSSLWQSPASPASDWTPSPSSPPPLSPLSPARSNHYHCHDSSIECSFEQQQLEDIDATGRASTTTNGGNHHTTSSSSLPFFTPFLMCVYDLDDRGGDAVASSSSSSSSPAQSFPLSLFPRSFAQCFGHGGGVGASSGWAGCDFGDCIADESHDRIFRYPHDHHHYDDDDNADNYNNKRVHPPLIPPPPPPSVPLQRPVPSYLPPPLSFSDATGGSLLDNKLDDDDENDTDDETIAATTQIVCGHRRIEYGPDSWMFVC